VTQRKNKSLSGFLSSKKQDSSFLKKKPQKDLLLALAYGLWCR
jgi:hypothetical protein